MNDKSEQKFQVNLVFTFKKETFQYSKNIPFRLKAFLHIYDDKWLPDLAKFYQIRGGYHSSLGAPKKKKNFKAIFSHTTVIVNCNGTRTA